MNAKQKFRGNILTVFVLIADVFLAMLTTGIYTDLSDKLYNNTVIRDVFSGNNFRFFSFFEILKEGTENYGLTEFAYVIRFLFFLTVFLFVSVIISNKREQFLKFVYKYRFLIGAGIIVLFTLLRLSGSSITIYNNVIGRSYKDLIFGIPRAIRSDEWATYTPMNISQSYGENPYSRINYLLRGTATDVFIIYGQPVRDFFGMIFRPFLNGFVLFGTECGLAFFWSSRIVVLCLVYFEFFMLLTKNKKLLSAAGMIAVAFSPVIQWWFAINGLVEMLVFGAFAVLLIDKYLDAEKKVVKLLCLAGLYMCIGGYAITFYPADMVPLAYVYVALAVWVLIRDRSRLKKLKVFDYVSIALMVIFVGASLGFVLYRSWDTVVAILGSDYPGKRISAGGGELYKYFSQWGNIFFPYKGGIINSNPCEMAVFIDLFPIGIIIAVFNMIRKKKADFLTIMLLAVYVLISFYCIVGIPEWLAKITLLGKSTQGRAMAAIGLINVIFLIRGLSEETVSLKTFVSIVLAGIYAVFAVFTSRWAYSIYVSKKLILVIAVVAFAIVFLVLNIKKYYIPFCTLLIVLCLFASMPVNPIQFRLGRLFESDLSEKIGELVKDDPEGIWVTDNTEVSVANYLIAQGARCINSTQIYPNNERWYILDDDHSQSLNYNRYAHIKFELEEEDNQYGTYWLDFNDLLSVHLKGEKIKLFDVDYVLSTNDLSLLSTDETEFELIDQSGDFRIYKVK